jgi:raffinose/stachyose/melibiose transport system substrate-binding protein
MKARKILTGSAALLVGALALTGCSGGGSGSGDDGGPVEMTLWHNSTTGPGKAFWDKTTADFNAANPGVTVTATSIQNEDLDGKLQTALNSGDAPDIFLQRGGGKLAATVAAGQVMDITDGISADVKRSWL